MRERQAAGTYEIPSASLRAGSSLRLKNRSAQDDILSYFVTVTPGIWTRMKRGL
jgi:hypothetical protein